MKVVIAGSRSFYNYPLLKRVIIDSRFVIDEVVNGVARGGDLCGVCYALEKNIPFINFPPDYKRYEPKIAPIIRNGQMADYADAAIIMIEDYSKGSYNMLSQMNKRNKKYYVAFVQKGTDKINYTIVDKQTEKDLKNGCITIDTPKRSDVKTKTRLLRFFESPD